MNLYQMKKDIEAIRESVKPVKRHWTDDIPITPEIERCQREIKRANEDARQRLIDSRISETEFKERERMGFICDSMVVEAQHNLLRVLSDSRIPDREPRKIKWLYDNDF